MCGIAGISHFGRLPDAPERVARMADSIRHRGPDGEGFWSDDHVAFGFRRLAIVDIAGGAQPMSNEDDQIWVIYNGEIYNHRELRRELEGLGHRFKTDHSDTEVLVHGWEQWGERLPERLNGMFAFAIWDRRRRALFLARDRFGIKPLYVARLPGGTVLFGSEIRAIHASGLVKNAPNPRAILEYFAHQNLWESQTMFADVEQFAPATWELVTSTSSSRQVYWDLSFNRTSKLKPVEAAEAHREILGRVIKRQLAADVPVMSYLSGGIDSSALAAAAAGIDSRVGTYACIFDLREVEADKIVDERDYSRLVARHLATHHVELELPDTAMVASLDPTVDALEDIRMGMVYVNYLIAQRVARDSKVVISGTGGDEIHAGYVYRYQGTAVQPPASPFSWQGLIQRLGGFKREQNESAHARFDKIVNFLAPESSRADVFTPEFLRDAGDYSSSDHLRAITDRCASDNFWDKVLYADAKTYLHGLLIMEDKLSMANSLEARVPLLDNELVDFVDTLPWHLLFDGETGKIVFRESVRPLVPDVIYRKAKMGFGPPDASWYRKSLRKFIERRLDFDHVKRRGIFNVDYVRNVLAAHFAGTANNLPMIWSLMCFESWCRTNKAYGGVLDLVEA